MEKVNVFFIGLLLFFLTGSANAQDQSSKDYFIGDWEVVVSETPYGDVSMNLNIERVDDKLKGIFTGDEDEIEVDNIEENETSITLFFSFDGYELSLFLEKEDDNNVTGDLIETFAAKGTRIVE